MNKKILKLLVSILFLVGFHISTTAQEEDLSKKGSFAFATNPSYFVLGGYHVKPSYHFPTKWSVGLTVQGGFELPDFARDQFFDFTGEDIIVDWTYAVGLELKYRFTDAAFDKGFFTALNIGYEGWDVRATTDDSFENWFASIDAGCNWYPFKKERFHVGLNYTLIFILNNTDDRLLGDTIYNIKSVVPPAIIPSILLGWRF